MIKIQWLLRPTSEVKQMLFEVSNLEVKYGELKCLHGISIELDAGLVACLLGPNGTGKTTTLAKLGDLYQKNGFTVIIAASDTYRAGSIEQLEKHAERLGIKTVKQDYGSDAAAIAYDAVAHARARRIDVVLIDTAGRMQTAKNLIEEMKKIARVAEPDLKIFIGDALAGNDALSQAQSFHDAIEIDGAILTKVDAHPSGGAALSITFVTGRPVVYVGVGQEYGDLRKFNPEWFAQRLISGK